MSAYGSYIVETFVTLVAVCALAFVLLYGAKRLGMGRTSGAIQLVGQLPLDARRCIYLVKVGGQVLVVGVGDGGFTKLAEMPADALPAESTTGNAGAFATGSFSEALARALGRARTPEVPQEGEGEATKQPAPEQPAPKQTRESKEKSTS